MGIAPHITREAQDDIEAAALWYEQKQEGLGVRFIAELDRVLESVSSYPLQFPIIDEPVRRALLRRFPYVVYFFAEGEEGRLAVLAVLHQRRDPDVWRRRL